MPIIKGKVIQHQPEAALRWWTLHLDQKIEKGAFAKLPKLIQEGLVQIYNEQTRLQLLSTFKGHWNSIQHKEKQKRESQTHLQKAVTLLSDLVPKNQAIVMAEELSKSPIDRELGESWAGKMGIRACLDILTALMKEPHSEAFEYADHLATLIPPASLQSKKLGLNQGVHNALSLANALAITIKDFLIMHITEDEELSAEVTQTGLALQKTWLEKIKKWGVQIDFNSGLHFLSEHINEKEVSEREFKNRIKALTQAYLQMESYKEPLAVDANKSSKKSFSFRGDHPYLHLFSSIDGRAIQWKSGQHKVQCIIEQWRVLEPHVDANLFSDSTYGNWLKTLSSWMPDHNHRMGVIDILEEALRLNIVKEDDFKPYVEEPSILFNYNITGNYDIWVNELLKRGMDPNWTDNEGKSLLYRFNDTFKRPMMPQTKKDMQASLIGAIQMLLNAGTDPLLIMIKQDPLEIAANDEVKGMIYSSLEKIQLEKSAKRLGIEEGASVPSRKEGMRL